MSVLERSAGELAEAVASRQVSAMQVLSAHLQRLGEVNPTLQAVAATRAAAARHEAAAFDARLAAGQDLSGKVLLGVPCTIQAAHRVASVPGFEGGSAPFEPVAVLDAPVVARLQAAGALVMGITEPSAPGRGHTGRLCGGRSTRNPWSTARTPGYPAGGAGAAVASGMSAFGIGSGMLGSIGVAAALCGTVGHQPTAGLMPRTPQHDPRLGPRSEPWCGGLLTRRVADVMPILRVIAAVSEQQGSALALGDPSRVDPGHLRIFRLPGGMEGSLSQEVRCAVDRAQQALEHAGCSIRTLPIPAASDGGRLRTRLLGAPSWRSEHAATLATLERSLPDDGVLLCAAVSRSAPLLRVHQHPLFAPRTRCLWSALPLPATTVPVGLDAKRLPLGVQLSAKRGRDHLCLAAAGVVEQATGGWQLTGVVVERWRQALQKSRARIS